MKKNHYLWVHSHPTLKKLIMEFKIAVLLIVVSISNVVANPTYSQVAKVTLDMENKSVEQVIDEIEKQSEFYFIFNQKQVDVNRVVDIQVKDKLITEILPELFKGTNVNYLIFDRKILLTTDPLDNSILAIATAAEPQQNKITGIVSGKDGSPLVGVNVVVTGTTQGTMTDINGKYSIEVPAGSKSLTFSFTGMTSQEITIGTRDQINVTMAESTFGLDEVVVVGYGTQKKSDLTGALSVVDNKDLSKIAVTDPLQGLQGKAAGVSITSVSGQPGTGFQVRIRGIQSINASVDPIYVIDGVISESMSNIDTYDIESISVLKDGASSAIYGARAANGVVLITTKHGTKNEAPVITFNTYQGVQTQPNTHLTLLNSKQWLKLNDESLTNDGYTGTALDANRGYTDADLDIYKDAQGNYRSTNWLDQISRTGRISYYDLSVSGGSEKSSYYTSINYLDQEGMIISQSAKKVNFRFNSDHKISNFIEFGNTLNLFDNSNAGFPDFTMSNSNNIPNPYLQAFRKSPLSEVKEPDGSYGINENQNVEYTWMPPTVMTDLYKRKASSAGLIGSLYLKFNLAKGLSFTPRGSLTYSHDLYSYYIPAMSLENTGDIQSQSSLTKNSTDTYHWQTDFMLNYDHTFNEAHNLSVLLAFSEEASATEDLGGYRSGIPLTNIYYLNAGDASTALNNNGYSDWSIASYIGRVNYDYKGKYLVQATVRRDGSSRFSSANRWGIFPSYSIGWRISKEKFFEPISNIVSDLKLRASSGTLGNANIGSNYPTYSSLSTYTVISNEQIVTAYTLENAINAKIKWETTKKNDVGVDVSFLKSKLNLTVDYFISKTTNMLYQKPLPYSSGVISYPYINGGEMDNKGLEFELGYREERGDFTYGISTNFSALRNKVIDLAGQDLRTEGTVVGKPYNSYFGLSTNGIIKTQAQLSAYQALSPNAKLGDVEFKDIDGYDADGNLTGKPDGVIDGADRTFIGKKYPDFTYGFVVDLSYKRFSLQIQAQGLQGITLPFTGVTLPYFYGGIPQNSSDIVLKRWNATENPNGNLPRLTRDDNNKNQQFSDIWLSDASLLKNR